MPGYKFSAHALQGHESEKWNAKTIYEAIQARQISNPKTLFGKTSDIVYGTAPDGQTVGLVLSKPRGFADIVIITGFAADEDYWKSV